MPQHVMDLLADAFSENNTPLENSTIAILGISYKPNVHDIQIAPSEEIVKLLDKKNIKIIIFDPYFKEENVFGYKVEKSITDALNGVNGAILITAHNEFHELNLKSIFDAMRTPILVDCTGIIEPKNAKSNGIIFRGIGRGDNI